MPLLKEIITIACTIKADIVGQDASEQDVRRILNFGHTFGHAMEAVSGYTFSHGGSVAVGMVAAARLSALISDLEREDVCRIEQLIVALGLERRVPPGISTDDMLSALRQDKKKIGDNIHFVMLRKIGEPFVAKGVSEKVLRETIEGLRT